MIILPVGLKLPFDPIDYLKQDYGSAHNEYVNRVVQSVRKLNEEGIQESIVVGFDVFADRVRDSKNADIIAALENNPEAIALRKSFRITDDPNAPAFRVEPELLPLSYSDLVNKVKEKNPNIKINNTFRAAMNEIKKNKSLCQTRYLDPNNKSGAKKCFYSEKAIDEILKLLGQKVWLATITNE